MKGVPPRRARCQVGQVRRVEAVRAADEYACCELLMARSEPIADASLPDIRARSRPGTAMAAMMPMMATTMSSSMSVKPLLLRIRMMYQSPHDLGYRLFVRKAAPPILAARACPLYSNPCTNG